MTKTNILKLSFNIKAKWVREIDDFICLPFCSCCSIDNINFISLSYFGWSLPSYVILIYFIFLFLSFFLSSKSFPILGFFSYDDILWHFFNRLNINFIELQIFLSFGNKSKLLSTGRRTYLCVHWMKHSTLSKTKIISVTALFFIISFLHPIYICLAALYGDSRIGMNE